MKKKEFSKIIIFVAFITFILTLVTGCILAWNGRDTSLFCYAIPSTGGVVGSAAIFYYRKAQAENSVKLQLYTLEEIYRLREKYPSQSQSIEMAVSSQESRLENALNSYDSEASTPIDIQRKREKS